ncbi:MAG TPA: beta-galactosidase [Kiritimatiellia bacterium]|nr:beta-galactosidase [Kiritimatiellia bacterium]
MKRIMAGTMLLLCVAAGVGATETEVLYDGGGTNDWTTSRDAERLAKELSLSEFASATDPAALRWRFAPKATAFNDIFLSLPVVRRFDTVRLRLKNEGAGFTLACKVRDASNAEWTAKRVPLKAGTDWQWVEFPASDWAVATWARDPDGKLDFPLAYFALIAFDIKAGQEYRLQIARVEIVRPDPPVATVRDLQIPAELEAGKRYPVSLSFSMDKPAQEEAACLAFRRGKTELFRVPLVLPVPLSKVTPGQEVRVQMELPVPLYAFGGTQSVALCLGESRIRLNGKLADEAAAVTVAQRRAKKCVAAVKTYRGTPTLFINGKPHSGMTWATYRPTPEVFGDFTKAGITLYTFAATPTESGYNLSRTTWTAPGEYDYSQLDERAMMLLKENPDAYFFPRLYLHAPKWWSAQHPDDIVLMDPGDGKFVPFIHAGGKPAPSWASEAWRRDTIEGLRRLVAHVESSPYADRVIGYHIASGTTEEWMMWGGNEHQWVDFSPANTARFRAWLRSKYGTDEALRAAWHDGSASLATAAVPTKAQRQHTEIGSLRDPAKEQAVIDFYQYNSDLVADTICTFAKAVKDITKRKKVVGAFYGYLLQLCAEHRQQNAGHLALAKVLASPDVDFITSPTSYAFRQLGGEGTSHFMSLFGSVKLHGKLWFDENDIRTSMSPGKLGTWGKPESVAGDILQQEKELANVIVNGAAQWWFDVGHIVYTNAALMARIGQLAQSAAEAQKLDRRPADEVAMVVDERSLCYMRVGDPTLGSRLLVAQLPALARIGAPVGHYLVTDLPKLKDHKVFFIMTSFAPTAQDRAAIEALKRDGHVLVFLYAPGVYRDGQLDESGMADLTGIRLRLSRDEVPFSVKLAGGHRLTAGLEGQAYGVDVRNSPFCYADDPEATVLGTLADGKPGLVVKAGKEWTAVFSAVPLLPARLMRNLAQAGGVHSFIETEDVVWASKELLAVCVKDAGTRTVRLPAKADVHDLYSGEIVGQDVEAFTVDFKDRATRVFVTE